MLFWSEAELRALILGMYPRMGVALFDQITSDLIMDGVIQMTTVDGVLGYRPSTLGSHLSKLCNGKGH